MEATTAGPIKGIRPRRLMRPPLRAASPALAVRSDRLGRITASLMLLSQKMKRQPSLAPSAIECSLGYIFESRKLGGFARSQHFRAIAFLIPHPFQQVLASGIQKV